jgi:hypothetical protein
MQNLKSISIPEPCHQSWQQMTPVTQGRHCESCCKTVTDFTKMTNSEIINYLSSNTNTCGRFEKHQLSNINTQLHIDNMPLKGRLKGWAMAVGLLWSMASYKAVAQTGAPIAQITADSQRVKCAEPMLGKVAMLQYREICGRVTDSQDNSLLPGVRVFSNSNVSTITDTNGNFKLHVPLTDTQFTTRFIGYSAQVIKIDQAKMKYAINIKQMESFMGEVVITKPPFFKRLFYRFIKRPVHKVFDRKRY